MCGCSGHEHGTGSDACSCCRTSKRTHSPTSCNQCVGAFCRGYELGKAHGYTREGYEEGWGHGQSSERQRIRGILAEMIGHAPGPFLDEFLKLIGQ